MIDIHSHAIFNVDNGATSLEQSIKMIKKAKEIGYEAICFTPNYNNDNNVINRKELMDKIIRIKKILLKNNIDMHLYLGEEVSIFPNLPDRINNIISLNDTRYVLISFRNEEDFSYLEELVYSLTSMDKVPIIAYPEKYDYFKKNPNKLKQIVKDGALLQININSLIGEYGEESQELAKRLLEEDMVSFAASDAHSVASYYKAKKGLDTLKEFVGEEKFHLLTQTNPCMALSDSKIENKYNVKKEPFKIDKYVVKFFKTFPVLERML